ncbi:MAG: hypothetical protein OXK80_01520 [Bdellovibrionales bacterium]|nr:hypothetical protein [Bdellovibrionales bacterium]
MKKSCKKRGQVFMEFIWMLIFIFSFLSSIFYLYDKSGKEIKRYEMGRNVNYDSANIVIR